jgi:DNA-directed RNA polymerase beta subunit
MTENIDIIIENKINKKINISSNLLTNDELILDKILDLLLNNNIDYFVKTSIEAYDAMVDNLKDIINTDIYINLDESNESSPSILLKAKDIRFIHEKIDNKLITAPVALQYKLNYYTSIEVKYEQIIIKSDLTKTSLITDWIEIVKLPIMIGSKMCMSRKNGIVLDPLFSREDPGGYFILKGNKKVIYAKPRIKFNEVLIFPNGKTTIETGDSSISISDISCHVISKHAYSYPSYQHYLIIEYKNDIFSLNISTTTPDQTFNIFSVIKSMSNIRDIDIIQYYLNDIYLSNSQEEVYSLITVTLQDSTKNKIDLKTLDILKYSIAHLSNDEDKINFLLYCVKKLLRVSLRYETIDIRDSYNRTKLMDTPGSLIEELFISYLKITKKLIKDKVNNLSSLNNANILSDLKIFQTEYMLKFFISNEYWGTSKKQGVCELILPINYIHQLELIRKISEDEKDKNVIMEKRRAHTDYQGFICSITSPTSKNIGLHKYLSLLSFINPYIYKQHHIWKEVLDIFIKENITEKGFYDVFLDGIPLVSTNITSLHKIENYVDLLKFSNDKYSPYTVYYIDYTRLSMHINTHGGRLLVPVVRLKNNHIELKFDEIKDIKTIDEFNLKYKGILDYVDTHWIDHNPIAMSMQEIVKYNEELKINYNSNANYIFKAVHLIPYTQYSISIALNPYASNQGAIRNAYLAKQLIGSITCNPGMEYMTIDKTKKHLIRGTNPLTISPIDKYLNTLEIPITITLFTEMCSDIKNQEDSYVMNWNAIARGAIVIYEYKIYEMYISYKGNEKFYTPSLKNKYFGYNFSKLGPDGIIELDEYVTYGDVLVCKIEDNNDTTQIRPKIEYYDQYSPGRVCKIIRYKNDQDAREYVIVKICKTSLGDSADKMSTDQGQKGVIGQIVSASEFGHNDMNFISSVKCSASAHTRMTGGQLLIPLTNYYAILNGNIVENNTFKSININDMRDYLEYHGFQRDFLFKVYREDSQLLMLNSINIIPLSFRRMKQLADDGNVKKEDSGNDPITHNPSKGKSGGIRIGRMEKDAFEIHGVADYLHSTINFIDNYYICNKCGIKADNICKICNNNSNIIKTKIPAALSAVVDYCLPIGVELEMNVNNNSIII